MDKYIIYCTEKQVKKALNLGAPIETYKPIIINSKAGGSFTTPTIETVTAEQMLGWVEEQGILMQIEPINGMHYYWLLSIKELTEEPNRYSWVTQYVTPNYEEIPSRRDATLAAIDAALDYLIKANEK